MSTTNLYRVFDLVADAPIGILISQKSDGPAIRIFTDVLSNPDTDVGRHPEDYVLKKVGAYDDTTGELLPTGRYDKETGAIFPLPPQIIATGRAWAEAQRQSDEPPKLSLTGS